jgi:hypothetical protein
MAVEARGEGVVAVCWDAVYSGNTTVILGRPPIFYDGVVASMLSLW